MGLRFKTIGIITCIFIAIGVSTHFILSEYLLKQVKEFELSLVVTNLERVKQGLAAACSNARDRVLDWGHWEETEDFVLGNNRDYVSANLTYDALAAFETRHFLFLKGDGQIFHSGELSDAKEKIVPLKSAEANEIIRSPKLAQFMRNPNDDGLTGLIIVSGEPVFAAISTITDNDLTDRHSGFIIFTRTFSEKLQAQIADQTQLPLAFQLFSAADTIAPSDTKGAVQTITESAEQLAVRGILSDMNGNGVMAVNFSQPRELFQRSQATRESLLFTTAAFFLVANLIVLWLLEKIVLTPIQRLAGNIDSISTTNDFSQKVAVTNNDEIGRLGQIFNTLLESLDTSYHRMFEAKRRAQEADAAKSRFISAVSHEIRTPIQSVAGMLRILKKNESSESKLNFIKMANDAALGLNDTINEILDFAKTEAGQMPLEQQPFHLRGLLKKCLHEADVRKRTGGELIDILYDIAPEVPDLLMGDPHRLNQILTNLMGNACKFTIEGEIELKVKTSPPREDGRIPIVFTVRDTGVGMAAQQLPHIFSPFYQIKSAPPSTHQGTGLGLAITKQIVQQMDGEISVTSIVRKGSTFTVTVPFARSDPSQRLVWQQQLADKILLVGPTSRSQQFMDESLTNYGYAVTQVPYVNTHNCSENLKEICCVVLLDSSVTERSNIQELVSATRDLNIPLIAVTAPGDLELRETLRTLGVELFISRPASAEDVLLCIDGVSDDPLARETLPPIPVKENEAPLHVLVADDTPTNSFILRSLLEEVGHTVEVVTNGIDLLNRLRPVAAGRPGGKSIDIVLTDIQMPLMDGDVAVKRVRLIEGCSGNQHLPIIAVTARALPEEVQSLKLSGIDEVLTKPINEAELLRIMKRYTGRSGRVPPKGQHDHSIENSLIELISELCTELDAQPNRPTPGQKLINIEDIFARSGKSLGNTQTIMKAFIASYKEVRNTIEQSSVERDTPNLLRALHCLKGLLLDAGAQTTVVTAEQFEGQAREAFANESETRPLNIAGFLSTTDAVAFLAERLVQELSANEDAFPQ